MKNILSTAVLCFVLSLGAEALACISTPDDLTLKGSTFSNLFRTTISKNCGFTMAVTSKKEDAAERAQYEKKIAEDEEWSKRNPYDSSDAYKRKREAFVAQQATNYPELRSTTRCSLKSDNGNMCLSTGSICETSGNCVLTEDKKTNGLVEVGKAGAYIFSVNADGKKDIKKPYLKITPSDTRSAVIESVENGQTTGHMEVNGELCTRSMSRDGGGVLEISGKNYVSNGGGCQGKFSVTDFSNGGSAPEVDSSTLR